MKHILEKLFFWRRWLKQKEKEWTAEDFVASVEEVMEQQERKNPALRKLHEKLGASPRGGIMKKIALTGNFGTGKSTVAWMFEELGANVIDTDQVAHEVIAPHTKAWKEIFEHFGKGILLADGVIDRKKLGEIIFKHEDERRKLEHIVHPHIKEEILHRLHTLQKKGEAFCIVDAPLLYEVHWEPMFDLVVVVNAPQEISVKRASEKHHLSEHESLLRWNTQLPIKEKVERADIVIDNTESLEETRVQAERLYRAWQKGDFHATLKEISR